MKKILIALAVVVLVSGLTAIVFSPKTAGYWIYTGYNCNKAKDYINADKAFDKALKLNPKSIVAWNCKGGNYQSQSRHAEALDAFNRALAIKTINQVDETEQLHTLVLKSESLNKLQRYEEAISTCDEYLGRRHNNENYKDRDAVTLNKMFAYGRLGHYKMALAVYGNATYRSRGYYERACIYSLMRDRDKAFADLSSAVSSSSSYNDDEASYKYKDLARVTRDFEWLWGDSVFINITTKTSDEWNQHGQDLAAEGRYEEARNKYNEAIRLGNFEAHLSKGYACLKLERYDEAIREFSRPQNDHYYKRFEALYGLACTYSLKGDKEKALTNLRMAIVSNPWKKSDTRNDPDFQWLWNDADFRRITR